MNDEPDEQAVDSPGPDDPADEAGRREQIEQRLRRAFRLAGDGEAVRQLMRMVSEYRWGQKQ